MTQFIALELASRDPSRLAADLAGHRRYAENRPHAALGSVELNGATLATDSPPSRPTPETRRQR